MSHLVEARHDSHQVAVQFEESLLAHQIQNSEEPAEEAEDEGDGTDFALKDDGNDIELR